MEIKQQELRRVIYSSSYLDQIESETEPRCDKRKKTGDAEHHLFGSTCIDNLSLHLPSQRFSHSHESLCQ